MPPQVLDTQSIGYGDCFAVLLTRVFSGEECKEFIELAEKKGFSEIHTNKFGEEFEDKDFRTDLGTSISDAKIAKDLYERIHEFIPTKTNGIHNLLRFNKYLKGAVCEPHQDDVIKKSGKRSKFTVIVYLNNDSIGATRLFGAATMTKIDILPKMGSVLIFDQRIPHLGLSPKKLKVTMRTDIFVPDKEVVPPKSIRPKSIRPTRTLTNKRFTNGRND